MMPRYVFYVLHLSRGKKVALLAASAIIVRAGVMIFYVREALTPDSRLYATASGAARWSSPVLSTAGLAGGINAVRGVAFLGIVAAVTVILLLGEGNPLPLLGLLLLPPGWYLMQASADGLGLLGFVLAVRRGTLLPGLLITCPLHLVAGLTYGAAWLSRRLGGSWLVGSTAGGLLAILAQWHLQIRYLIPAIASLVA